MLVCERWTFPLRKNIYFPVGLVATGVVFTGLAVRRLAALPGCLQQALPLAVLSFLQQAVVEVHDFLEEDRFFVLSWANVVAAKNNTAVIPIINFFITICFL
jgi:hypothetical protein